MDTVEVPEYFICPISLQIMKDPVTAITGITYDRESIEKWLFQGQNTTCPVTKRPLPRDSGLTPNHMLHRLIQVWCTTNESQEIDPIPTLESPFNKFYFLNLIRNPWLPNLQLKTLRKLETLAMGEERNKKCMVEGGVAKAMILFLTSCYKKNETIGLEEALRILYLIRSPPEEKRILLSENGQLINSLTWVLGFDLRNHVAMKIHALLVLKTIVENANSSVLERLDRGFFERIVSILRESVSQHGIKAALHVMLGACPWGRNRMIMVEVGAVFQLIEVELGSPEKRTTELILGVLSHLCSCADGRAQFLSHAAGIAVVTKRIMKVSPQADDRAMLILSWICKFSGTSGVLQEMLMAGTVTRLCMVLQVDCESHLKDKAREILRKHSNVWKHSPCIDVTYLTRYPASG